MLLKRVKAKKIKDSRGEHTIEVSVNGQKASSPSGKSKGRYETPCFHKSIFWNIKFLNSLNFNLTIGSFSDLKKVESFIKNKSKLNDAKQFGANALFALECSILKALAKEKKKHLWEVLNSKSKKLPIPVGNAVGGGLHSHNKNAPNFQEFLIIPKGKSARQNAKIMNETYKKLKSLVKSKSKNDEGAWETALSNEEIFAILSKFKEVRIGSDIAASSYYKNSKYRFKNKVLDRKTQIRYINFIIDKYNLIYIEDPLHEDDFDGFSKIIRTKNKLVVADDLTATQIQRVKEMIKNKSANAMIIKPNQNGSLLELQTIFGICKKHKIKTILSHRSGETLDDALADLAVGFQADYIKAGISTKWREVKLKRLVEIEKRLQ
jgi:enolase